MRFIISLVTSVAQNLGTETTKPKAELWLAPIG